ncbi:MAG: beta-galactosidase [Oceanipulchritudo sp.]
MQPPCYDSLDPDRQLAYWNLPGTDMQHRLRNDRACQFSTVYFGFGGYDKAHLESEFRRMVDLGFNAVRFYTANPEERAPGEFDFRRPDDWVEAAERAGIGVIFHTEWFHPSDALLEAHGMDRAAYMAAYADDPAYIHVLKSHYGPLVSRYKNHPALSAWGTLGEPDPAEKEITSENDKRRFGGWLERKYGSLEALDAAWNVYPENGRLIVDSFNDAWQVLAGFHGAARISGVHRSLFNYGAGRDRSEFLTEKALDRGVAYLNVYRDIDPNHPVLTGSHQLFCNQAAHRWDSDRWAKLGDCFTTSIHLAWHFDLVEGEVDRPLYMQARQTRDWFKGGFTSCYETTGGPVQYSGGFGNSMSAGLMRRLILNYLAAGNINFSFWVWNSRPGGWEAGEYGLTSLSGALTPWAEEAGRLVRLAKAYKDELWESGYAPEVGILSSWDTDAILEMEPPRHDLAHGTGALGTGTLHQQSRARIGASRAFINHHISFEYLTDREVLNGIGKRYPVIYAPHLRSVSVPAFEALTKYVEDGGILIADVQFGFLDSHGKLRRTGPGSMHDRLFGAWFENIHDARTGGPVFRGGPVSGFYADMAKGSAACLENFDTGEPAITQFHHGNGQAILLAIDPAREAWKPGNQAMESLIAGLVRRHVDAEWKSSHALTFRLRTTPADHFFLLNDGPATEASIDIPGFTPEEITDVTRDRQLPAVNPLKVLVPANSGIWIRVRRTSR